MNFKTLLSSTATAVLMAASLVAAEEECSTIAEIACGTEGFETLCAAVTATGLAETLSVLEYTVFAPTDDAFAKLPEGTVDTLLAEEGLVTLTDILLYHVVYGTVMAADLSCAGGAAGLVTMANGEETRTICCHSCEPAEAIFQKGAGNPRLGDGSAADSQDVWPQVVTTDIEACNGVIHVVNNVILPLL